MKKSSECLNCHKNFEYRESQSYGMYCSNKCQGIKSWELTKERLRIGQDGKGSSVNTIKKYLHEVRGQKCEICHITEWLGKPLITILDHIDGNSDNWKFNNLRLICSNCDSTLPTYKKRNVGNGRFSRRKRYSEKKSY